MEWISIPAIITGLQEVAKTIGQIVIEEHKKKPFEKDIEKLYRNVRFYYKKALEIRRGKGDAKQLAGLIDKDDLFYFFIHAENADKIVCALRAVAFLDNKEDLVPLRITGQEDYALSKRNRAKLIYWILKCLEATKNVIIQLR